MDITRFGVDIHHSSVREFSYQGNKPRRTGEQKMKDLALDELELIDKALNAYRESLEELKYTEDLKTLEDVQNSIREEWRYIKGWDI
jgi:hypothetical protein